MKKISLALTSTLCVCTLMLLTACSSMQTPATADVAVSKAAVDNATTADAAEYAPLEMNRARDKLAMANRAMADHDYKLADTLANEAQADAKLALAKANSAKARAAAAALQDDVRVLREELQRSAK